MSWSIAPILGVRHVTRAKEYYCDRLGFECPGGVFMGVGDEDEGGVYAIVERDDIMLHLQIRRREIYPEARLHIESDVYLYVEDADGLHGEFSASGARILRPVVDGPNYGLRDFIVEDLDGNRLVFGSPKHA